ncbi:MAG: LamG domain-containing protein, partial [Akkermansiaceae bacterium]|nr:LamG domain-containing protein [Akkermansiaceae bacterium]
MKNLCVHLTTVLFVSCGFAFGQGLNDGLVAYYPFNGNAEDESGNGNNGTVDGATLTTDRNGNPNNAYDFSNSSIIVPDAASLDLGGGSGFAISVWVNPRSLYPQVNNWAGILSKFDGSAAYTLDLNATGVHAQFSRSPGDGAPNYFWRDSPIGGWNASEYAEGSLPSLDTWTHIAVAYNNDSITCYVNGQPTATRDAIDDLDPQTTGNPLTIGMIRNSFGDGHFFDGQIDDIRVYNRALSDTEVTALYDLEKPDLNSGLVAYYPFNGNADDESGNGNNGSVNGAALTADRKGNADSAYSFDGQNDFISASVGEHNEASLSIWFKS